MTTYIDRIVTEVAVTPESERSAETAGDTRWLEAARIEAVSKARARQAARLKAEGRDE